MLVKTLTEEAQEMYAAFGRGDIATLLDGMTGDVCWTVPGAEDIPWTGEYRGKEEVQGWFIALAQSMEFMAFEPREFIAQDDRVVAFVYTEVAPRTTGKKVINPEVHSWIFKNGKLANFQIYHNTAALEAAYRG